MESTDEESRRRFDSCLHPWTFVLSVVIPLESLDQFLGSRYGFFSNNPRA
jgi:hypothetical protein